MLMSRYGVSYTLSRLLLGCSFSLINRRCYHRQVKTLFRINENELGYDDGCYFKRIKHLKGELVVGVDNSIGLWCYYIAYIVKNQQLAVCWDLVSECLTIISKTGAGNTEDATPEEIACGFCWDWGDELLLDYDDNIIWSDKLNIRTNTNSTWELFKIVLEKYKDVDIGNIL